MNKTKVKYPRCNSDQLYKFGLDKQANQKYQCKKCKRLFAPDSVRNPVTSKYPRCPKSGKATFLHQSINTIIVINVVIRSAIMSLFIIIT